MQYGIDGVFFYRNSQRILHIPFFSPEVSICQEELSKNEERLKKARHNASSSVGAVIELGSRLTSPAVRRKMRKHFLPYVTKHLNAHFRVQKCYTLALATADLVSLIISIISQYACHLIIHNRCVI